MLKEEHAFVEDLKALATDVRTSFHCMVDAFPLMKTDFARESVTELLKVSVKAAKYLDAFTKERSASSTHQTFKHFFNRLERVVASQFRQKLDDYRNNFRDCRDAFREAAIIQVLVNSGDLSELRT